MNSLKDKTARGISWSLIDGLSGSGISFIVGLVLARLLGPRDYGIIGIISIFISLSHTIVDSGFGNALVQKLNTTKKDYNTVFIFNVIISCILYSILFLLSPYISNFFSIPILTKIIRIFGIILIINAIAIIPRTLFVRNINFKVQTKISLTASIISAVVGIGMAIEHYGVWSLVGQQISKQAINTLLLFLYSKWIPSIEFSWKSFNDLFGYGSKLLLSGIISNLYSNLYTFIIGRTYKPSILGYYTKASDFETLFSSSLTSAFDRVTFPALSSIQNDNIRLKNATRKILKMSMLITILGMFTMGAVAKPLLLLLIGDKWLPAVSYLQILCIAGAITPLHSINLKILQIKGRSDLFLKLEIYKKILYIAPLLLGILFGIYALLWTSVINSFIAFLINASYSKRMINYSILEQLKDIYGFFIIALIILIPVIAIIFLSIPVLLQLIIQILIAAILSHCLLSYTKSETYSELKNLILNIMFQKNKSK